MSDSNFLGTGAESVAALQVIGSIAAIAIFGMEIVHGKHEGVTLGSFLILAGILVAIAAISVETSEWWLNLVALALVVAGIFVRKRYGKPVPNLQAIHSRAPSPRSFIGR